MGVQLGIAPLEPERPPIGNRRQAAGTGQLLQPGSPGARSCGELAILRRVSDHQCARGAVDPIPGNRAAQRNRLAGRCRLWSLAGRRPRSLAQGGHRPRTPHKLARAASRAEQTGSKPASSKPASGANPSRCAPTFGRKGT